MGSYLVAFLSVLTLATILVKSETDNAAAEGSAGAGDDPPTGILSRRKRSLVFPDGSSFQLVFCTENMGYLQIDLVWVGITAALAWELPTDPSLWYFYKDKKYSAAQRRGDVLRHVYYLDEKGKLLAKVPYTRKLIVNPAFAKRSIEFGDSNKNDSNTKFNIRAMHKAQTTRPFLAADGLAQSRIQFHRDSRKSLYKKLETFLTGLGWDGRSCVLRMLCESNRNKSRQGNFVEEILRAVFTLPQGRAFESLNQQQYDAAHAHAGDCSQLYPECEYKAENMPLQFSNF
ncbi:hypothetical protein EVAR_91399_1 [Eumeta japonica]|uniref:Uncharacterized protein n=1 Tax=Eumeta variegata TaxID=151549 RepID=A0A4C1XD38_EUMVA|nr:hypothetical protein EVAR_91399_1 [Eumeta japonica]